MTKPTVLITGASSGIGATYAKHLAVRGHDLILVARDIKRLTDARETLEAAHGVKVTILPADLSDANALTAIETRIAEDTAIGIVINNAGLSPVGPFLPTPPALLQNLIDVNITAVQRLTYAAAHAFSARGSGAIINIASVVALMPERFNACYAATKAFVLAMTNSLQAELGPKGVRLQAVLPGLTRTEIFERAGFDINNLPPEQVMTADDMVAASLAGFDKGETVTIPSLPDAADWERFEAARIALIPNLSHNKPAARYELADA